MNAALNFKNVSVSFSTGLFRQGKVQALDGLNLEVQDGSIFGILGANGAGKSTAVYVALGMLRPDRGRCEVYGEKLTPGCQGMRQIGYLPEEAHYHGFLRVKEALYYYSRLVEPDHDFDIDDALARVGMLESKDRFLKECSKGMRQRLGLAQAIIHRPRLLILDEPTRGLDPVIVHDFRHIIEDLNKAGTTIFLNSHVLSEVEMICTRVGIMNEGKLVLEGDLDELLSSVGKYRVRYRTEADLGFPGVVNDGGTWDAVIAEEDLGTAWDKLRSDGVELLKIEKERRTLEEVFVETVVPGTGKGEN